MTNKQYATQLFINNTNHKPSDIKKIKEIHNGYTNVSFRIDVKKNKVFQIRLPDSRNKINHVNEKRVLDLIGNKNYIYYDAKSGNAIKTGVDGSNPTKKVYESKEFLQAFAKELKTFHATKIKGMHIKKHNYYDCVGKANLDEVNKQKYVELTQKYINLPLVLSHNDLSPDNLLWTVKKRVIFIDFEGTRLNNEYWDIANFIRETQLSDHSIKLLAQYTGIKNIHILGDFVYMCTNYAYQGTFNMPMTKKILAYRKRTQELMNKYCKELFGV